MKVLCLYIMLFLLGCSACKTDVLNPKEELPAATQEGKNTIGFLVDGNIWLPKGGFNFPAMNGFYENGSLYLRANRTGGEALNQFGIDHGYITGLGTFNLYPSDNKRFISTFFYIDGKSKYITSSVSSGELNITKLDSINEIISGTFYFDAVNEAGEIVEIRDGRFDLKY